MSIRDELLRTIIENPDDDTPRLVFADWLDEHGEPDRAEFIRVQIELTTCPQCKGRGIYSLRAAGGLGARGVPCKIKRCISLREREEELRGADKFPEWCPKVISCNVSTSRYSRGFVESIDVAWEMWLAHSAAILAATPLREVRLTTQPPYQWVGNVADLGSPPKSGLKHAWPHLKFTLPSPIILPSGLIPSQTWTDDASGPLFSFRASEMPIIYEQGFARAVESITVSSATALPVPPADPSSSGENI